MVISFLGAAILAADLRLSGVGSAVHFGDAAITASCAGSAATARSIQGVRNSSLPRFPNSGNKTVHLVGVATSCASVRDVTVPCASGNTTAFHAPPLFYCRYKGALGQKDLGPFHAHLVFDSVCYSDCSGATKAVDLDVATVLTCPPLEVFDLLDIVGQLKYGDPDDEPPFEVEMSVLHAGSKPWTPIPWSGLADGNKLFFDSVAPPPTMTRFETGTGTFVAPSSGYAHVLVVAGGGSGGGRAGGGGGGGGVIDHPGYAVTAGESIAVTVGEGGAMALRSQDSGTCGISGEDSTFGALVAKGGAGGGSDQCYTTAPSGGSGAGAMYANSAGSATQPSQAGDSGKYGHGHDGASGTGSGSYNSGGGGGAGGPGTSGKADGTCGNGGPGYQVEHATGRAGDSSNAPYFGGGGAGGSHAPSCSKGGSGGVGGGGDARGMGSTDTPGGDAVQGTGGGGAGGSSDGSNGGSGGKGGRGFILVTCCFDSKGERA